MKNIFDDNAQVTILLTEIKESASHIANYPVYHELGAIKAELHMIAQKFPEVEAYLANINATRAKVLQF